MSCTHGKRRKDCPDCQAEIEEMNSNYALSGMLCGCGKSGRYQTKGGIACNKYHRCPTYDELSEQVITLKVTLFRIRGLLDEAPT